MPWILIDKKNKSYEKGNILVSAFMQIDSLWQCPQVKCEPPRKRTLCPILSYYSPLFLHRSTFSTLHALFHVLSTSFSLFLIESLESVFVPLNIIEKSIETHSTIFHFEKSFLGKKKKSRNEPIHSSFCTDTMYKHLCKISINFW